MKTVTVKKFHDEPARMLNGKEPLLVTRHGATIGFYTPLHPGKLPPDLRWQRIEKITQEIRQRLRKQDVSIDEVLDEFEKWRQKNRKSRR